MDNELLNPLAGSEPSETALESGTFGKPEESLLAPLSDATTPAGEPGAPLPDVQPERESDYLGAALSGAKSILAPLSVTDEDVKHDAQMTKGERIAKGVASVVTDLGGTLLADAGIGMLAGSVVPGAGQVAGAVGGLMYGLYKAYGQEKLHQTETKEEFSPIRAAINVAANMNPILRYGSGGLAPKLIKGATQAGLEYAGAKAYGADDEMAGISALVGGAMGGAFHGSKQADSGLLGLLMAPAAKPTIHGEPMMNEQSFKDLGEALGTKLAGGGKEGSNLGRLVTQRLEDTAVESAAMRKRALSIPSDATSPEAIREALGAEGMKELKESIRGERLTKKPRTIADEPVRAGEEAPKSFGETLKKSDEFGTEPKEWLAKEQSKISMKNKPSGWTDEDYMAVKLAQKERDSFAYFAVDPSGTMKRDMKAVLAKYEDWRSKINLDSEAGRKYMDNTHDAFKAQQAAYELLGEEQHRYMKDFIKDPLANRASSFMLDQMYAGIDIDHRFGTQLEPLFNELSHSANRNTAFMELAITKQKAAYKLAQKAKLSPDEIHHLLTDAEYRAAALPKMGPKAQEAVEAYQKAHSWLRDVGRENGLNIGELADYALQAPKTQADSITALRREFNSVMSKFAKDPKKPTAAEMGAALAARDDSKQVSQFLAALEQNSGLDIKRPSTLAKAMDQVGDIGTIKRNTAVEAKSTFERRGEIPKFIQENNIDRLFLLSAQNAGKTINFRDVVRDLESQVGVLHALGAEQSRDYVSRVVRDVMGADQNGMPALANAMSTKWKVGIDKLIDDSRLAQLPGGTGLLKAAKDVPDLLSLMMYQIYPNFLGSTLRGIPRNLMQPLLMTAPELQGGYGVKAVMKATGAATAKAKQLGIKGVEEFLQSKGMQPAKFQGESYRTMRQSLTESAPMRVTAKVADAWTDVAMKVYGMSDTFNRFIQYHVAEQLAKDLVSKEAGAMKWLGALTEGYKATLERAARKGASPQELTDIIAQHLNAKTQFNYGRQSLGEYGRAMGPMFTMFTKWPVVVASEARYLIKSGQADRVLTKYLAPFGALALASRFLPNPEESPRAKVLMGYGGLKEWSPAASLFNIGSLGTPPVFQAVGDLAKMGQDAASKDWEAFQRHGNKALLPFVPGYGIVRGLQQFRTLRTGMESR